MNVQQSARPLSLGAQTLLEITAPLRLPHHPWLRRLLGMGTTTDAIEPGSIPEALDAKAVAAGGFHSLALRMNGYVWAWGNNSNGQLGDGTHIPHNTPRAVLLTGGVKAIAAGAFHSLAVRYFEPWRS